MIRQLNKNFIVFKKSVHKLENKKTVSPYNLNEILTKFDKKFPKNVTIKDLQEEIRQYKIEVQELRQFTTLGLTDLQYQINKILSNQKIQDEILESSKANEEVTNSYLNTINKVIFQKWEVSLVIIVKDKFVLNTIALIDSGTSMNCIQEGLIPTKFYEKSKQVLFEANGKRLKINYKLSNAHVCNQGICIR